MVVLNYTGGEINAKIVYYGPGVSGKTTNLEFIHEKAPQSARGKMVSMKTQTDRTLFFDFLPLELGDISGYRTRFLLYTVPGQVYYNATRKLVLKGVDAIVFVADSSRAKLEENMESLRNLEHNLNEHGLSLDDIPWVIQYNKRDIPDAMKVADLNARLNPLGVPTFEAVATLGTGVYETLHGIATLVYGVLKDRLDREAAAGAGAPEDEPSHPVAASQREVPEPAKPPLVEHPKVPAPQTVPSPKPEPVLVAAAAPQTAVSARPAPESGGLGGEQEFDDAIDMALRESPASRDTSPAPPKLEADPRDETPDTVGPDFDGDDGFGTMPDTSFDTDLGHLRELDEVPGRSDTAGDAADNEFVTDPMRHSPRRQPATRPASPRAVFASDSAAPEPAVKTAPAPRPAPSPAVVPTRSAVSIPVVEELHATVYVSRAQLERASWLRVVVDVELDDEDDDV